MRAFPLLSTPRSRLRISATTVRLHTQVRWITKQWPRISSTSSDHIRSRMFPSSVILCKPPTFTSFLCAHIPLRGGKVAMAVALSPELPADAIEHLIVADIAPSSASLSTEFQGYIDGMNKIEQSNVNSRREAHDILSSYEPVRRQLATPSQPSFFPGTQY